jgi:YHS domain-containing protein
MCVAGLAAGKRVQTDCSVNWQSEGKTYCFSGTDAKSAFLKDPGGLLTKAKENFAVADAEKAEAAMTHFTSGDAQTFVDDIIKKATEKNGGVYPLNDALTGQTVALVYDKIDFTRTIHGYGFFPDVIFHAKDDPAKRYLVDFWVRPQAGKLSILDVRIYKAPKKEGTAWIMMTRQPKPWWWIPASEHPGESEVKRSWEVMSVIEDHVLTKRDGSEKTFKLKDDKTGEEIALEFVGLHQPVRRLKENGRFFACSDFRKKGTTDQFYDVDFWLDEKDGVLRVTEARIHKVPVLEDGSYTQVPRYSFDPQTFDVVP